jgi:hypothetical protein
MDESSCDEEARRGDDWEGDDPFILFVEWSSPAAIAAFDNLVEKP